MHHMQNAYRIPNMHYRGYLCKTNLPSFTAFRGFGGPQSMFVAETIIRQAHLPIIAALQRSGARSSCCRCRRATKSDVSPRPHVTQDTIAWSYLSLEGD